MINSTIPVKELYAYLRERRTGSDQELPSQWSTLLTTVFPWNERWGVTPLRPSPADAHTRYTLLSKTTPYHTKDENLIYLVLQIKNYGADHAQAEAQLIRYLSHSPEIFSYARTIYGVITSGSYWKVIQVDTSTSERRIVTVFDWDNDFSSDASAQRMLAIRDFIGSSEAESMALRWGLIG